MKTVLLFAPLLALLAACSDGNPCKRGEILLDGNCVVPKLQMESMSIKQAGQTVRHLVPTNTIYEHSNMTLEEEIEQISKRFQMRKTQLEIETAGAIAVAIARHRTQSGQIAP